MRLSNLFSRRQASDKLQQRNLKRRRLSLEPLEDRRLLTVTLTYGGLGTALSLVQNTPGAEVDVSERTVDAAVAGAIAAPTVMPIGSEVLVIHSSDGFAAGSTLADPALLGYDGATPAVSANAFVSLAAPNTISNLYVNLPAYAVHFGLEPLIVAFNGFGPTFDPLHNFHGGITNITVAGGTLAAPAGAGAASVTVDGGIDTSRNNGNVSLAATGAVTVHNNAIINTGTGKITLDAGGTLTINPGAVVTSANTDADAITLQGADVVIDTTVPTNLPFIGGQSALATTPSSRSLALTGAGGAGFAAVDPTSGNVYVAKSAAAANVSEYSSSGTFIRTITLPATATVSALAVDPSDGSLYVADITAHAGVFYVYKYSSTGAEVFSVSTAAAPIAVAVAGSHLYVLTGANLFQYATATGQLVSPAAAAIAGGFALAVNEGDTTAYVATAGFITPVATGTMTTGAVVATGVAVPGPGFDQGLAVDQTVAAGNVFLAGSVGGNGLVQEYTGALALTRTVFLPGAIAPVAYAATVDNHGNLFVSDVGNHLVSEITSFVPGGVNPVAFNVPDAVFSDPTWAAGGIGAGIAYDPTTGNLYLAEATAGTVSVFMPTALPGGVVIDVSTPAIAMNIGTAGAGLSLDNKELAQIKVSASGKITIGDSAQTAGITFKGAQVSTTGATIVALQSTAGGGSIKLDDSGVGTALDVTGGSISLTAGTGGILANANDTVAEIHTTGATVTLDTTGPIGTAANRIQFADNANPLQQNVVVDPPSSVYLDGLGSLTLGSVAVSSAIAGAVIDVTARANLVVAPSARIDGGIGTISLGADLKADGTADDGTGKGVGTLSIRAGATVTTGNTTATAITLRGADINLDTGLNPAVVGGVRGVSGTAAATISGLSAPQALLFDNAGNLYVANAGDGTVSKFAPGSTTASMTLSGLDNPDALVIDGDGNLYVANSGNDTVSVFSPTGVLVNTIHLAAGAAPAALVLDSQSNLFVANAGNNTVSEIDAGTFVVHNTIGPLGLSVPIAMAFDSKGNLFVANSGNSTVSEIDAGTFAVNLAQTITLPTPAGGVAPVPSALAFDSEGNLWVADSANKAVKEFPVAGGPLAFVVGTDPVALAFDQSGNLFVVNRGDNTVSEIDTTAATTTPIKNLNDPVALAFDRSGNLFLASSAGDAVSKFAATLTPTAAGVVILSSSSTRPMSLGGANNAVAGINLTDAELARIVTTAVGTVTVGNATQTGDITFTTAKVATTAGAATTVVQDTTAPPAATDTTGTRQIILDDAGTGTALNGNGGLVTLTPGVNGIEAIIASPADVMLVSNGFTMPAKNANLTLILAFVPTDSTKLTIIDNTAAVATKVSGTFANQAADATIQATYNGVPYTFHTNYAAGDGNDLALTRVALVTVGLVDTTSSTFYLQNSNSTVDVTAAPPGHADMTFTYQPASGALEPITGDWTNNGGATIGFYDPTTSTFYLRNSNDTGAADIQFQWGPANSKWTPIAGDWTGDGKTEVGLYDPSTSTFHLATSNDSNSTGVTFMFGSPIYIGGPNAGKPISWQVVVGDWTGAGKDAVGLFDPATLLFYLRNSNSTGTADNTFLYGSPVYLNGANVGKPISWKAVAGDWTGTASGAATVGLFDPAQSKFYLRNSNTFGVADNAFVYRPATGGSYTPIVGYWRSNTTTPQPLLAADVGTAAGVTPLTLSQLQPIASEAIARWTAAGLPAALVAKLKNVSFSIATAADKFSSSELAVAANDTITIDPSAAGHGWFVDPTPAADEEFTASASGHALAAVDPRAVDTIDLLTAVEHELGHIAGLSSTGVSSDDIMSGVLGVGVRREVSAVDAALAN